MRYDSNISDSGKNRKKKHRFFCLDGFFFGHDTERGWREHIRLRVPGRGRLWRKRGAIPIFVTVVGKKGPMRSEIAGVYFSVSP